jgi:hypothetical protein
MELLVTGTRATVYAFDRGCDRYGTWYHYDT